MVRLGIPNSRVNEQVGELLGSLGAFAERYLVERGLRPNTLRGYRQLLKTHILPTFRDMPLSEVSLTDIKTWRTTLDPDTPSSNAAAYRLLRSILQAAEQEELIGRPPHAPAFAAPGP